MNGWISTIILLLGIVVVGLLLVTAYIVTPIIEWLSQNLFGGLALTIIFFVLVGILVFKEFRS